MNRGDRVSLEGRWRKRTRRVVDALFGSARSGITWSGIGVICTTDRIWPFLEGANNGLSPTDRCIQPNITRPDCRGAHRLTSQRACLVQRHRFNSMPTRCDGGVAELLPLPPPCLPCSSFPSSDISRQGPRGWHPRVRMLYATPVMTGWVPCPISFAFRPECCCEDEQFQRSESMPDRLLPLHSLCFPCWYVLYERAGHPSLTPIRSVLGLSAVTWVPLQHPSE